MSERQDMGASAVAETGSHASRHAASGVDNPLGFDPARIEALLRSLLRGLFSSLTISFNDDHACNYMTAQQWAHDGDYPAEDWVSEAERDKALATNSVWSIQWYPDTPVGFCRLHASSLDALVGAIAMEARQGRDAEERPDPKDDSAGRNGIAQPPSGDS